jgi:hypothetical protein
MRRKGKRYGSQFGIHRPVGTKRPLPRIMVVCDDTRTAVRYFKELQRVVKEKVIVDVVPASRTGADPSDVLKQAVARVRHLRKEGGADPRDSA